MYKKRLRLEMRKASEGMPEDVRNAADAAIYDALLKLSEYKSAENIFIYISSGDEVSTEAMIQAMLNDKKNVFVPLCYGAGIMDAVQLNDTDELRRGLYGIPEPPCDNQCISPEKLSLIIVPGVCFSEEGGRLGRGAGYYDRYISRAKGVATVGLCRENNLISSINTDAHDEQIDIIITEKRTLRVADKEKVD